MPTVGTCGKCGGPVQVPELWSGTVPPVPTCSSCGARVKDAYGPVLPMETAAPESLGLQRYRAVGFDAGQVAKLPGCVGKATQGE